ncbi:Metallo-dependent phosphatase-like protein [Immersiella caudata]|uniref:Metallo-dependent phosphatase-like protein n=1 Tax=Immersiella caudata TaxID=314043 RepID=A0AA39XGJ9_9PEZI|nr:Metallo-dependent phosphatase-like protein [Immersiella caudata]
MSAEPEGRPPVADLPDVIIATLPTEHAISSPDDAIESKPGKRKRLVFVGDVHGHLSALQALLEKISFDHHHGDHLVFAGDIVTKGPDSAGVIKLAMDVGASGVRGNHDDNVLLAHKGLQKKKKKKQHRKKKKYHKSIDSKHVDHARAVARSLSPKQIRWLSSLPIVLRIGQVTNATSEDMPWDAGEIVVVHAGLVPGVPLEEQDPWAMMNMRTLLYPDLKSTSDTSSDEDALPDDTLSATRDEDSEQSTSTTDDLLTVPSDTRHGEPWSRAWNLTKGIRYAFGIDSGCGHGRQLTALVLEAGPRPEDGVLHHIEQVECGEVEK